MCAPGTYNDREMQTSPASCVRCPDRSFTVNASSTSIADCLCAEAYYMGSPAFECLACPPGAACDVAGATLSTLPVRDGYWQMPGSADVRPCPASVQGCGVIDTCRTVCADVRNSSSTVIALVSTILAVFIIAMLAMGWRRCVLSRPRRGGPVFSQKLPVTAMQQAL